MTDYESDSIDGKQPRMVSVPAEEWERQQTQIARLRAALEQVYDMFHNDPQLALVQWDIVSVVRDTLAEDDQEYLSAMKNSKMIDDYFKDGEP